MSTALISIKDNIIEHYLRLTKPIRRWKTRIKVFKVLGKIYRIVIGILGPAMSIFLMVDGFMNKGNHENKAVKGSRKSNPTKDGKNQ